MPRPRPAVLVLTAALTGLAASGVGWAGHAGGAPAQVADIGARPKDARPSDDPRGARAARPGGEQAARGFPRRGAAAQRTGPGTVRRVEPARPRDGAPPVRLALPTVGVVAPVVPVGVGPDGQVRVPDAVDRVGWYRFGPAPGAPAGSAVLVGHRDGRDQGYGVLAALERLGLGDRIVVDRADGSRVAFRVVARESLRKATLPTAELFARTGAPRLTLVTCGGAYDPQAGGYERNVVVTAVPEGAA